MKKLLFTLVAILGIVGTMQLTAASDNVQAPACNENQLTGMAQAELHACLQQYHNNRCFELGSTFYAVNDLQRGLYYRVEFFYGPNGSPDCPRGILTRLVGWVEFDSNCNLVGSYCY